MKMPKMKRVLVAVCMTAGVGAVPLVTATAAHADQVSCVNAVKSYGYNVGPKVRSACSNHGVTGYQKCIQKLVNAGVRFEHAVPSCNKA